MIRSYYNPANLFPREIAAMGRLEAFGDVVRGDNILFYEPVWATAFDPSRRCKPVPAGYRTIIAEVVNDSYGDVKQQHTFTLRVLESSGHDPLPAGSVILRKGRNVYRNGCWRLPWPNESARATVRQEKHSRGDAARIERAARRQREVQDGSPFVI
jgi:hypothetical protein